mmetsp:Transcript_3643/g.9229  ORF Transcript_3643/g.9229 Transcript_3643/m.9229 type:complete len:246 (-) Transcript_3643:2010-2747(-)
MSQRQLCPPPQQVACPPQELLGGPRRQKAQSLLHSVPLPQVQRSLSRLLSQREPCSPLRHLEAPPQFPLERHVHVRPIQIEAAPPRQPAARAKAHRQLTFEWPTRCRRQATKGLAYLLKRSLRLMLWKLQHRAEVDAPQTYGYPQQQKTKPQCLALRSPVVHQIFSAHTCCSLHCCASLLGLLCRGFSATALCHPVPSGCCPLQRLVLELGTAWLRADFSQSQCLIRTVTRASTAACLDPEWGCY